MMSINTWKEGAGFDERASAVSKQQKNHREIGNKRRCCKKQTTGRGAVRALRSLLRVVTVNSPMAETAGLASVRTRIPDPCAIVTLRKWPVLKLHRISSHLNASRSHIPNSHVYILSNTILVNACTYSYTSNIRTLIPIFANLMEISFTPGAFNITQLHRCPNLVIKSDTPKGTLFYCWSLASPTYPRS